MRPVGFLDLIHAARALLLCRPVLRGLVCDAIIAEAHAADGYRKRHLKVHPHFGSGTLSTAAQRRRLAPERAYGDAEFAACCALVFERLAKWRRGRGVHAR